MFLWTSTGYIIFLTTFHFENTWPLKFLLFSFPCPKNRWRVTNEIWLSFIIHPMSFLFILIVTRASGWWWFEFDSSHPDLSHPTQPPSYFDARLFFILPGKQFHFNILTPSKAEDDGFETIFMYVMRKSTFEPAWKSGSVGVWGVHNF